MTFRWEALSAVTVTNQGPGQVGRIPMQINFPGVFGDCDIAHAKSAMREARPCGEYARVCGESANHAMPIAKVLARKTEEPLLLFVCGMKIRSARRRNYASSPSSVLGLSDADKEEGLGLSLASLSPCRFDRGGNFH